MAAVVYAFARVCLGAGLIVLSEKQILWTRTGVAPVEILAPMGTFVEILGALVHVLAGLLVLG